jgi:hypothetical protein
VPIAQERRSWRTYAWCLCRIFRFLPGANACIIKKDQNLSHLQTHACGGGWRLAGRRQKRILQRRHGSWFGAWIGQEGYPLFDRCPHLEEVGRPKGKGGWGVAHEGTHRLVFPFQDGVCESNDLVVRVALVGSRDFFSLSGLKHQKKKLLSDRSLVVD